MIENRKVLLVEDDFLTREVISEILQSENYNTLLAENGKQGLEKFEGGGDFQLIISDLNMPEMNGLELIKAIRQQNDEIPIIILTGNSEVQVAMDAINNGANDYLLKDENIQNTIIHSINRVLEKQKLINHNRELMEDLKDRNEDLAKATNIAEIERKKADDLILNILPHQIADELKNTGKVSPQNFKLVSIMFADLKGFTRYAWDMEPHALVAQLNNIFEAFDKVCHNHNIEKLKTIGDAYMCAGGLPALNYTHPVDICRAAMEFQKYTREIKQKSEKGISNCELRIGIHSGSVTAGVIGKTKSSYDMWGDAVNVAARMESNGEGSRINISASTYPLISDFFACESRGELEMKNRGKMGMYYLTGIRPELSVDGKGLEPNPEFELKYKQLKGE